MADEMAELAACWSRWGRRQWCIGILLTTIALGATAGWLLKSASKNSAPYLLPRGCSTRGSVGAGPVADSDGATTGLHANMTLEVQRLERLYRRYAHELKALQAPARTLCSSLRAADRSFCSTDDVEAELTYMRVREALPAHILELAPRAGYSTFFLLAALLANRPSAGLVHSFDLEDLIQRPMLLRALGQLTAPNTSSAFFKSAHRLVVGDAKELLPPRMGRQGSPFFDYLFLDADHSGQFGTWLGHAVLRRQAVLQAGTGRRTPVSMHDVYHNYLPSAEAHNAFEQLPASALTAARGSLFTAAKCRLGTKGWRALSRARKVHGLLRKAPYMHVASNNPTLFFEL